MKVLMNVELKKETQKALLIETNFYPIGYYDNYYAIKNEIWIPKSAIQESKNRHGGIDYNVKDWVIEKSIRTIKPTNGREEDYIMGFVGIEYSSYKNQN